MKARYLIIIFLSLLSSAKVFGQSNYSNYNSNGTLSNQQNGFGHDLDNDDQNNDSTDNDKDKVVPHDVKAWVLDDIFGNMKPIEVDTLRHAYQNNSLTEGMKGEYGTLGNLGSPRLNRVFMDRDLNENFIFVNPFDQFYVPTNKFRHYDTKSPYMNIAYNFCGSKTTGYDNLNIVYSQNAGKRVNFGARYAYMYGQGFYNSQNTGFMNASAWGSYRGDKYAVHFYYQHNYMKMAENGGITDETYITHPENQAISVGSTEIPTYLDATWNRQEHHLVYLNQHYNIGFERMEGDSTHRTRVFVPVMKFFHTLKLGSMMRNFRSYENPTDYYSKSYLTIGDTINDYTKNLYIRNNLGISLCEGFQKWAAFGLNAYIGYEHRNYQLPDTIEPGWDKTKSRSLIHRYTEYDLVVGGQMIRTMGSLVHYNVDAEFAFAGENIGQFTVSGHGELNIPFLKDTLQIAANAYIKNTNPSFYYRHFHSTYSWWDQETSKEMRQRIQGVLTYPKTKTNIICGFENIKNYAYFANTGTTAASGTVTNNAVALQCGSNIQIFSITLNQNLKVGPVCWENSVTFQTTSNADVLPLPKLNAYTNLYLDFKIAKVLSTEIGADMKYFTNYYAPDYSPVIGQFTTQNANKLNKIGNHPLISAYVNFHLKLLRFYVQYYHFNAGTARAFWGPGYPMNPTGIHFGLSWNFYD